MRWLSCNCRLNYSIQDAMEDLDGTLRMLDADELSHYKECRKALSQQEDELAVILSRERLEWYTNLRAEQDYFLQQAMFRRGLALGLRLGALTVLW